MLRGTILPMANKVENNNSGDRLEELRKLYPHYTEEQLRRADVNVRNYVDNAVAIYRRLLEDPEAYRRFRKLSKKRKEES